MITFTLGSLLLASPAYLAARQDQGQSQGQEGVADAARKARAQKKDAPKSKMVIDNDNLGTLTGTINVVGEAAPPPADDTKKPADAKAPKSGEAAKGEPGKGEAAKDETYWRHKFADAYKKLADDQRELDVTQRESNLKQQQYYADPMATLKQEYTRQDLNDAKAKIDELTAKVAQDKTDISNLEDELRQAGGEPGWASPPSQPAPSSTPQ
jgi:hypothetical protein